MTTIQDNHAAITIVGNDAAAATTTPLLKKATEPLRSIGADTASVTSSLTTSSGGTPPPQLVVVVKSRTAAAVDRDARSYLCKNWCGSKYYADMMKEGLEFLGQPADHVVMLFESPSTCNDATSFFNNSVFPVHDYPPAMPMVKTTIAPLRYSMMNGPTYPSFLDVDVPEGLFEHWARNVPGHKQPTFVNRFDDDTTVYPYLPLEHVRKHLNDPHVHYHLAGKAAIHLMTDDAPRQFANTTDERPCVAKVTHSMGSKGIFIIHNDEDEKAFRDFLEVSGNPSFVVTEMVDIDRSVSCHFFIHPSGEMTWIGSSENHKDGQGGWCMDSIIELDRHEELKALQLPYARKVVDYCLDLGFWGFCGIDILFNAEGKGYVVDVNPRTTGTSPSLMLAQKLETEYGYQSGLLRRSSKFSYPGPAKELLERVQAFNDEGKLRVVLLSFCEAAPDQTFMNISIHGNSLDECRAALKQFSVQHRW